MKNLGCAENRGFTLVELAIVMTIIGLLIGGILKGQELVVNARVNATIAQVKGYEAAFVSFRDSYNGLPGDLFRASTILPGCTPGCDNTHTGSGIRVNGDGTIGPRNFAVGQSTWQGWESSTVPSGYTSGAVPGNVWHYEFQSVWAHLNAAGLITGVTDEGLQQPVRHAWGVTLPAAAVGGGFVFRDNRLGQLPPGSTSSNVSGRNGYMLLLVRSPHVNVASLITQMTVLTPLLAQHIDTKMDDGRAGSGQVMAFDHPSTFGTCYAAGTDTSYDVPNKSKVCGLVFYIAG